MKTSTSTIESLIELIEAQSALIKQLEARIHDLEHRLNKKSSNSSKPPSRDGLSKPPKTTSLPESGKNKSGGQFGHKGETLKHVETPDKVKRHLLTSCPDCQSSLESNNQDGLTYIPIVILTMVPHKGQPLFQTSLIFITIQKNSFDSGFNPSSKYRMGH